MGFIGLGEEQHAIENLDLEGCATIEIKMWLQRRTSESKTLVYFQ
jgi:hypothetical protein